MNSTETDEALMQQYQEGHAMAFDVLFERHRQKVWGFLLKRLANRENAEEVFQMTWIKFHESRFRYDPQFPLVPWIYLIARQNMIDWVRRSKKHLHPVAIETFVEEVPSVDHFLNQMTSEERELYEAHFVNDQTFDEISKKSATPSATLRKRFSRMVQRLKEKDAR